MRKLFLIVLFMSMAVSSYALNVALGIDCLVPSAEYRGSTTENTEAQYNDLVWTDARPQPTWADIVNNEAQCLQNIQNIQTANDKVAAKAEFETRELKAFVKILIDEINILRANDGLSNRTIQQLRNAIDAEIDAQP